MRTLIIGLGLIGGSIGIALRRRGWHVTYLDPAVDLDQARSMEAADQRLTDIPSAPESLVIVAAPVDQAVEIVRRLSAADTPLTSVCSVMAPLRDAAGMSRTFVASHPFAGSHENGIQSAREGLFVGKNWFLEPEPSNPLVEQMIEACGATPVRVPADEHDAAVAMTSHLPQLLSSALAALIERRQVPPHFLGSGLATFLRLAASRHEIWEPVIEGNRKHLGVAARELAGLVSKMIDDGGRDVFCDAEEFMKKR